ncbi:hypothetical protein D9619_007640 [Psilocybe cf. subviscida]|uniref:DUF6699 domain-containing protein n=1 Tax=Psilocybe cf. subviscida TaxID=2480587 RepID=A0A8H5ESG9_9AGAR|nr:hypothetical protein D9619_007640 [Psilocybe cf. subviscida]
MSTRILLNPLLKPEILYWEISSRFEIPTWRLSKFRATATTPPIHAMTFMVPGLPFHLQPLGPSHRQTEYITVSDVLDGIYERLNTFRLQDEEYDTLFGWQKQMARESCCTREEVAVDLQDEEFFRESIRGIDLMRGRLHFGGMLHQRDENGANIWIVVLQEEKGAPSPSDLPHLLNPGGITWDFKDPPPVFDDSEPFGVAGEPMVIVDINSHPLISINPPSTVGSKRPFTPRVVLEAIYASLNVRVRDNTWPFWDSDAARIAKDVLQNATTTERDNIITYLDMLPAERQRFLGLWPTRTPMATFTPYSRSPRSAQYHRFTMRFDEGVSVGIFSQILPILSRLPT